MKTAASIALLAFALALHAQAPAADAEQVELNQAMGEVGQSAVDIIRVLERHLAKYPNSERRAAIEQTLLKSAMDTNDSARIILYGEKILANPTRDLQLLDRVALELVKKGDADSAKKALQYIHRYQNGIADMRKQNPPPQHFTPGQWAEQMDRASAHALALEARARENSGDSEEALRAARSSWAAWPTVDAARVTAAVLKKMNRESEAIQPLADAFALHDPTVSEADRAADRAALGALYAKINGSEKGLGDLILQAYDRVAAQMKERAEKEKTQDPNALAENILDFTLPAVNADKPLVMSSLKGKVVVMDFWATWCVPCRAQHPLLENVKKHFADKPEVVFLPLDADDDTSLAAPFLKEQRWDEPAWFEGGLERKLQIASIPTVVVLDPAGRISSRMIGMIPERFEDMLTERINDALAVSSANTASRP